MPQIKPTRGILLNKSHLLSRGLVFFPPFNEGTGKKVFDLVNGNMGTFGGNTAWIAGKFGSALEFDGIAADINFGDKAVYPKNTPYTIYVVVTPRQLGSWTAIVDRYGGSLAYTTLNIYQSSTDYYSHTTGDGAWNDVLSTTPVEIGVTRHVVSVWDNTTKYIYVDGKLENSAVPSANKKPTANGGDLTLAARNNGSEFNDCIIHFALLYNRALSASEIALLKINPFCMFEPSLNIARISFIVANGFVEIAGSLAALSFLTDSAALKRSRVIAGGVTAQSSLAGSIKVSRKISGVINATSSLSGTLSLVGEVSRSRGSGFKPIEGAERLRGLRRSAFY